MTDNILKLITEADGLYRKLRSIYYYATDEEYERRLIRVMNRVSIRTNRRLAQHGALVQKRKLKRKV